MESGMGQADADHNCLPLTEVSLAYGRSLIFSPTWPCSDATVLFDRNSGDYWVISLLGARALKLLQTHGEMTVQEMGRQLEREQSAADMFAALEPTLRSLVETGLVQPVH